MNTIIEMLTTRGQHLVERFDGPLNFRLIVMPVVVTVLAIRAGLRDAREGRPSFLAGIVSNPAARPRILLSAVGDVGRIFIVAIVLDSIYQIAVVRTFYLGELLFVAVACAIVPYLVMRGPAALLARYLTAKRDKR